MKKRTSTKRVSAAARQRVYQARERRLRRRWGVTAAVDRQVDQMVRERFPAIHAFDDCLAKLEQDYGVNPKRVRKILIRPNRAIYAVDHLREVRSQLTRCREALRILGTESDTRDTRAYREVAALITRLERDETRLLEQTRAADFWTGKRWTTPPAEWFWGRKLVPGDETWLNPRRWPWLRKRAVELAAYLMTTGLVDPRDRLRTGKARGKYSRAVREKTAELITAHYRMGFPRLLFTAEDVRVASESARARAARGS